MFQKIWIPALIICILLLATGLTGHAQIPLPDDNETPALQPPKAKPAVTKPAVTKPATIIPAPVSTPASTQEKTRAEVEIAWLGTETAVIIIDGQEFPMRGESSRTEMLVVNEVLQVSVKTPVKTYHAAEFLLIPAEGGSVLIELKSQINNLKANFVYISPEFKQEMEIWEPTFFNAISEGFGIVHNSATGRYWLDRNLGASRVATSATDEAAYGDLYQWGRGSDGHEKRSSSNTRTLSTNHQPGHGSFICSKYSHFEWEWRTTPSSTLWQGAHGINNPCPSGFRLPTEKEWNEEMLSWSMYNPEGAFNSPLKLTAAGARDEVGGGLFAVGRSGHYHSSTVSGLQIVGLATGGLGTGVSRIGKSGRAGGKSVRCIKD